MDQPGHREERAFQRPSAEWVRVVRAEEAQAALDAGEAAARRPGDTPRFGDVPATPTGPRPVHRFPLPGSVDPANAVSRPPLRQDDRLAPPGSTGHDQSGDPAVTERNTAVQPTLMEHVASAAHGNDGPPPSMATSGHPSGTGTGTDVSWPEKGNTVRGGEVPHWTESPTGEVPHSRPQGRDRAPEDRTAGEMAAWGDLGTEEVQWREEPTEWDDVAGVGAARGDETRFDALDTGQNEHSEAFSFDEQFEHLDEEEGSGRVRTAAPPGEAPTPAAGAASGGDHRGRRRGGGRGGRAESRQSSGGGRNMTSAVIVGLLLLAVLLITYAVGPAALMALATVIVAAGALELFGLLRNRGFRPATLVGLLATVAVMLGAYWRGEQALPLILVLALVTSMLWYMLGVVEARPLVNVAVTVMAFVWVGVFGSFASLLLRVHHGRSLLLLPVLVTVVADIVAYFAGSIMGSRPLARSVSPGKTWEGTIVGGLVAIVASVVLARVFMHDTWSIKHAFALGVIVAVLAPLGDLCESMVKRDLHIKDSGTVLPGHGGLLDRFDALLFVLPATYYLCQYLRLLK